jgi:hypothetical protein
LYALQQVRQRVEDQFPMPTKDELDRLNSNKLVKLFNYVRTLPVFAALNNSPDSHKAEKNFMEEKFPMFLDADSFNKLPKGRFNEVKECLNSLSTEFSQWSSCEEAKNYVTMLQKELKANELLPMLKDLRIWYINYFRRDHVIYKRTSKEWM